MEYFIAIVLLAAFSAFIYTKFRDDKTDDVGQDGPVYPKKKNITRNFEN